MRNLLLKVTACLVFLFPAFAMAGVADCLENGARLASCAAHGDINPVGTTLHDLKIASMVANYEGFVEGIALGTINRTWCPGQGGFGMDAVLAVVSKFLRDHPEQWNNTPANLTIRALATAFPCKKPAGP